MRTKVMERHGNRRASVVIRTLAVVAALAAATGSQAGGTAAMVRAERAQIVRNHVMRGLDGKSMNLASLKGEVVVINFWASWCRPCRREMPELNALHAELSKQGGRVVAISIDEDVRNARRFIRDHKLHLPVYHDGPSGLAHALALDHIPYTLILDRNGEIVYATAGDTEAERAELASVARRLAASDGKRSAWNPGGGQ